MINTFNMHSWGGPWLPLGILGVGVVGIVATLVIVAMIALKGYALWHAAKRDEKGWFVALLILNTFGVLELIYLYFVVKKWRKHHHSS